MLCVNCCLLPGVVVVSLSLLCVVVSCVGSCLPLFGVDRCSSLFVVAVAWKYMSLFAVVVWRRLLLLLPNVAVVVAL